jgi:hypothetical protein
LLVDLLIAGRMTLQRLIARYDFANINRAAADATPGVAIRPAVLFAAVTTEPAISPTRWAR